MARFMENKSINPKFGQDQIPKELRCSRSTLQRYREVINMLSPYRFPPNFRNRRKQKISNHEYDLERPQMTSKKLNWPKKNPFLKGLNLRKVD